MWSADPVVLVLGFVATAYLFGGLISRRGRAEWLAYWPCAWAALLGAGLSLMLSDRFPGFYYLALGLASLFPALLLAGAFLYADRAVPRWLLPAGLLLGGVRAIAYFAGWRIGPHFLALLLEPLAVVAAAVIVHRASSRLNLSLLHRLIAPGLLLVAIVEATDASLPLLGNPKVPWLSWLLVAIPLASIQLSASVDRLRGRAEAFSKALVASEERFRRLFESNIVGVVIAGAHGDLVDANDAFLDLLGYSREELPIGWRAITPPEWHTADRRALRELKETQAATPYEKEFIHKDGRRVPVLVGASRVDDDTGTGLVVDLSERKRVEAALDRHQHELEELVQERTRELLESRDKLREAERLVGMGTLTAGIAHQINNPIGVILSGAEYALLCENDQDAKTVWKRALESTVKEAQRCGAIVRSMLQFTRNEPTDKWVEDLNQVVRRAHRVTSAYARDHSAEVDVALAETPLPVFMSPIEVEQVLVNVIRNGIESLDSGVHVEVHTEQRGSRAHVELRDNGRGIELGNLGLIFDPFFSTRLGQGGTGLGLSVAHGIVLDHGGEIRVESEPGKGATVVIELPLSERPTTL